MHDNLGFGKTGLTNDDLAEKWSYCNRRVNCM